MTGVILCDELAASQRLPDASCNRFRRCHDVKQTPSLELSILRVLFQVFLSDGWWFFGVSRSMTSLKPDSASQNPSWTFKLPTHDVVSCREIIWNDVTRWWTTWCPMKALLTNSNEKRGLPSRKRSLTSHFKRKVIDSNIPKQWGHVSSDKVGPYQFLNGVTKP